MSGQPEVAITIMTGGQKATEGGTSSGAAAGPMPACTYTTPCTSGTAPWVSVGVAVRSSFVAMIASVGHW